MLPPIGYDILVQKENVIILYVYYLLIISIPRKYVKIKYRYLKLCSLRKIELKRIGVEIKLKIQKNKIKCIV